MLFRFKNYCVILANLTLKKFSESVELKVFTLIGVSLLRVFVMII